jgi:predicted nuclease of restriction endonuclease-like (RecB) superfamily
VDDQNKPSDANVARNTVGYIGYEEFLREVKIRIQTAQGRAALAVNRELVLLYWEIGSDISRRMQEHGWGAKVVDRISADLRREFPTMQGFSPRNLRYMRSFAEAWPDETILQQAAAKIPWFHNCVLLDKTRDQEQRLWYARQTIENGWSRAVLVHQIETRLYERQGKAVTNFERTLPASQSDLAQQLLKDPFNFDFLTLHKDARERELQDGLITHIRQFLLELGRGFAFVGSPYRLEVGGDEFEIDMLFYHLKLRCYVVIDLKIGKFAPEDAGQMNFYLSAVDDLLRHPDDRQSVGLILCRTQNAVVAEYALRDINKPIGVATHLTRQIEEALPQEFKYSLPTVEEIEAELANLSEPRSQDHTDD